MMGFGRNMLAALALLGAAVAAPAAAADAVYVMRHLQKAQGDDPPLSAEGAANAGVVAQMLATAGIKALFATPTRRAEQTAAPLAAKLGLPVTRYNPRDPSALVKAVADVRGAALVVGHSNTVPDLVAAFGGERPAPLIEQDYGTIFLVEAGKVRRIEIAVPAISP